MISYAYTSAACFGCHPSGVKDDYLEHDGAFFPIYSGAHNGTWVDCATCHTDPNNRSVYDCLACHEQVSVDVVHQGMPSYSYISSVCFSCHATGAKEDYLEHDGSFFPIYSGNHNGVWVACATCHTDPNNRSVYDCLACHEQAPIDLVHQGMPSYSYTSADCFGCHPSGAQQDYLEHDGSFFPIYTGYHSGVWVDCASCHTDPNSRTVFDCLSCHEQSTVDVTHAAIAGYQYESNSCYACHPDGEAGPFLEHDALYFPIYSGTHNTNWASCNTCHLNLANPADFSCVDACHRHNETRATAEHFLVPEFTWVSSECYRCHPTGEVTY